jgi:NAD(P)H-hydrate epimerase
MLPVVSAPRAAALDAYTIAQGVPSRALMQRAGAAAAGEIAHRFADRLERGVLVLAGPGNNGGDGWVIARALRAAGVKVRVASPAATKTPDAIAERELFRSHPDPERSEGEGSGSGAPAPDPSAAPQDDFRGAPAPDPFGLRPQGMPSASPQDDTEWPLHLLTEPLVVDALLGTGASGEPRGAIAEGIALLREARAAGATIVAIDLPSGLDATTGDATHCVPAHLTLTFGTVKRGHLVARDACGTIAVLDIGLLHDGEPGDPRIADARLVPCVVPPVEAAAHKGTRGKLTIVGGAPGMAGAVVLAARAALRCGIGMVKALVAPESVAAVQKAEPFALAAPWPTDADALRAELAWADGVVLGPGLGRAAAASDLAEQLLRARPRAVIDADGLNVMAAEPERFLGLLAGLHALLTPHPAEAARLLGGIDVVAVLARRWEVAGELARSTGATVLLKGVPTILSDGTEAMVSASGTPVLATGGSGDVLSGIAGTLMVQGQASALLAGWAAAWIHGRAAELAGGEGRQVRGVTLDAVLEAIPHAWAERPAPPRYPVLLELAAVGET